MNSNDIPGHGRRDRMILHLYATIFRWPPAKTPVRLRHEAARRTRDRVWVHGSRIVRASCRPHPRSRLHLQEKEARPDRPSRPRLRRTRGQRRLPLQRRPALPRHGPRRVLHARVPLARRRRRLRPGRRGAAPAGAAGASPAARSFVHQEQHRPLHQRHLGCHENYLLTATHL